MARSSASPRSTPPSWWTRRARGGPRAPRAWGGPARAVRARAVASGCGGPTAAPVRGAPIGAAVGQALGWRFTFWTLVVFGGLALIGLLAFLPSARRRPPPPDHHPAGAP